MKIKKALLKSEAKHPLAARSLLDVAHGDDLTFEGGLLTARVKGEQIVWPTGSFWWMEPLEAKAAKK